MLINTFPFMHQFACRSQCKKIAAHNKHMHTGAILQASLMNLVWEKVTDAFSCRTCCQFSIELSLDGLTPPPTCTSRSNNATFNASKNARWKAHSNAPIGINPSQAVCELYANQWMHFIAFWRMHNSVRNFFPVKWVVPFPRKWS